MGATQEQNAKQPTQKDLTNQEFELDISGRGNGSKFILRSDRDHDIVADKIIVADDLLSVLEVRKLAPIRVVVTKLTEKSQRRIDLEEVKCSDVTINPQIVLNPQSLDDIDSSKDAVLKGTASLEKLTDGRFRLQVTANQFQISVVLPSPPTVVRQVSDGNSARPRFDRRVILDGDRVMIYVYRDGEIFKCRSEAVLVEASPNESDQLDEMLRSQRIRFFTLLKESNSELGNKLKDLLADFDRYSTPNKERFICIASQIIVDRLIETPTSEDLPVLVDFVLGALSAQTDTLPDPLWLGRFGGKCDHLLKLAQGNSDTKDEVKDSIDSLVRLIKILQICQQGQSEGGENSSRT